MRLLLSKKPFTESKTELKDTVIWLSYSKYVNDNKIDNPYFLTTNVNDFCKTAGKDVKVLEVHDDLKADCDKFTVFKYTKDFISEVVEKVEAENKTRFKEIAKEKITDEFISEIVYRSYAQEVEEEVSKHIDNNYDTRDIFNIDYFFTGYVGTRVTGWGRKCSYLATDTLTDQSHFSGQLELHGSV